MMVIFLLGVLFISSLQPMMMVSSLILITLFYSFLVYKIIGSYWFMYALVMVMLSGVLVVFTYMVTLIPNENFEVYSLMYMFVFMIILGEYSINYFIDSSLVSFSLWVNYLSVFCLFLVTFLLLIMLMVVWLSYMGDGAMRVD